MIYCSIYKGQSCIYLLLVRFTTKISQGKQKTKPTSTSPPHVGQLNGSRINRILYHFWKNYILPELITWIFPYAYVKLFYIKIQNRILGVG